VRGPPIGNAVRYTSKFCGDLRLDAEIPYGRIAGRMKPRLVIALLSAVACLQGCDSKKPATPPRVLTEEEAKGLSLDELATEAARGGLQAQLALADRYFFGDGVGTNLVKACELYAAAAKQGDARAQYLTGCWMTSGKADTVGNRVGLDLMRKSAEQGYTQAEYELGATLLYADGASTVVAPAPEAFGWLQRAADKGHGHAEADLGVCYSRGLGVPKDPRQAATWFRKAADQGITDAQYALGVAYMRGQGVGVDYSESYKWFSLAADKKLPQAAKALRVLTTKASKAQIAEGMKRKSAFSPKRSPITQYMGEVFFRAHYAILDRSLGNPNGSEPDP
jgi:TPR repeat protein